MSIWSSLSKRFQNRSSFHHPHDYEELQIQIQKFVSDAHDSVATALAGVFAISVNKICKIMEIFE